MSNKCIALIPLRGGSKGIPKKNIKMLNNRPLCDWVIKAALASVAFDQVWVSTDCEQIKKIAKSSGAKVHMRNKETATDTAPTSLCILDFLKSINSHTGLHICIIQATSPFTMPQDFNNAYQLYLNNQPYVDGLVSCTRIHQFRWSSSKIVTTINSVNQTTNMCFPLNYNIKKRPRRQDWLGELIEDGSFYIVKAEAFLETYGIPPNNRCVIYEMQHAHNKHFEIDDPIDFDIMELLAKKGWGYQPVKETDEKTMIVIDIGGTYIRSATVHNKTLTNKFSELSNNLSTEKVCDHIKRQLKHNNDESVAGICISTGGIVIGNRVIESTESIDNWCNIEFPNEIDGIPVVVANDGDCSLLAEKYYGSCWNSEDSVVVVQSIGTGVGIGIEVNGKLINETECGKMFEDTLCGKTFNNNHTKQLAEQFAIKLINLVELLSPDRVIINGFVSREYPDLVHIIKTVYSSGVREHYLRKCKVCFSVLEDQGLLGASCLMSKD